MTAAAYTPIPLTDEQIFTGFEAVAPLVKMTEERWKAMDERLSADEQRVAYAQLYFALGVRWRERVGDMTAHEQLLAAAAEPDSPTIALPGVDFGVEDALAEFRKRGR